MASLAEDRMRLDTMAGSICFHAEWLDALPPDPDSLSYVTEEDLDEDLANCLPSERNPYAQQAFDTTPLDTLLPSPGLTSLKNYPLQQARKAILNGTVKLGKCWVSKKSQKPFHLEDFKTKEAKSAFYASENHLRQQYLRATAEGYDHSQSDPDPPQQHSRPKESHDAAMRKSYNYKKVKGTFRLYQLFLILTGQADLVDFLAQGRTEDNENPDPVFFHASHLCGHPECYRPSHVVFESAAANYSRTRCLSTWIESYEAKNEQTGRKEIQFRTLTCPHGTDETRCHPHYDCPINCAARRDMIHWARSRLVKKAFDMVDAPAGAIRSRERARLAAEQESEEEWEAESEEEWEAESEEEMEEEIGALDSKKRKRSG